MLTLRSYFRLISRGWLLPLLAAWSPLLCAQETEPQPSITLRGRGLQPESRIELRFPADMISLDEVGKTEPNRWMSITPPWKSEVRWDSTRRAHFLPGEAPALETVYQMRIEASVDRDGKPVPASEPKEWSTPGLEIEQFWLPSRHGRSHENREPVTTLRFSVPVDVDSLRQRARFKRESGGMAISVEVRGVEGWGDSYPARWRRQLQETSRPESVDGRSAYEITPRRKLPVGDDWKLVLEAGVVSADGRLATRGETAYPMPQVLPMRVRAIQTTDSYHRPRSVSISWNKPLHADHEVADLAPWISIQPPPGPLELSLSENRRHLAVDAAFVHGEVYEIRIHPGIVADDGLALDRTRVERLCFRPLEPFVALPSMDEAQLRFGQRTYTILAGNLEEVRLRVKRLSPWETLFAKKGQDHYLNQLGEEDPQPVPYDLLAGTTIQDRVLACTAGLDRQENVILDWNEILGPGEGAALLVHVDGKPREDVKSGTRIVAQALVQVTDLGLAWKRDGEEMLLYVYSHATGEPVSGASVSLYGPGNEPLGGSISTDIHGVATLPDRHEVNRLVVMHAGDHHLVTRDEWFTYSPWQFDHAWTDEPLRDEARCLFFTDWGLYRPGETVHLKGVVRRSAGQSLELPRNGVIAALEVRDGRSRIILDRQCPLSARGAFSTEFELPESTVGTFTARLRLAAADGDDGEEGMEEVFWHSWEVQGVPPQRIRNPSGARPRIR